MLGERRVAATVAEPVTAARPGERVRSVLRTLRALRAKLTPPPGSAWRDPVTIAVAVLVFGAYFAISLFRLLQLTPGSYDLGIYVEYVKQLAHFHAPIDDVLAPGFNLLGDHFQIAVGLIAPFFRLVPSAGTLLFCQALLTAVSIFPVVTAASTLTGRSTGRLIGFAYGFSWGLQQMIDFDFHEVALAVPLIAFSVSALARRRPLATILWALPLVFVKEDQGFTVAAIGFLLMITMARRPVIPALPQGNGRLAAWGGLALVTWGMLWSVLAITVIIPHFNPHHVYSFWADGGTVGGHLTAGKLLVQAGGAWPTKGQTLVLLVLPTAFAALGSPLALIALPSLALRFISTNPAFWGTYFHYNATVMPVLFIAAAEAIARWRRARALAWPPPAARRPVRDLVAAAQSGLARHGGAMMAAIAVALAFQFPISGLWRASTYRLGAHVAAANAAMAVVPDGATVQTTLDLLAPLAARTDTFWIGNRSNPATSYIVFDGANSGYSPAVTDVPGFIHKLYPGAGYVLVFARDGVYVFRRGPG